MWELRETTLCNQPATAQAPDFAALEAEMFCSAHNQRYACRHYLLTHGGPGDMHDTLTSQFQRRALRKGVYVSELVAGRIVAYWVNFWVNLMRQRPITPRPPIHQ